MTSTDTVTVVIPHYGAADMTETLCRQLLHQQGVTLEIIVVDDHSPTPARPMEQVRLIRRPTNGGFGSAVNTGAAAASGDLLLLLNSDISLGESAVADLVASARASQPCVAAPALLAPDGSVQHTRHRWPGAWRSAFSVLRPLPHLLKVPPVQRWLLDTRPVAEVGPTAAEWVSGAALLIPRRDFMRAGGFDESFFMFGEDVDLQARLTQTGVPSCVFRAVEMTHVGGGSTDPERAARWSLQARWLYAEKHGYARRLRAILSCVALINAGWNMAARVARKNVDVRRELRHDVDRARGRVY